MFEIMKNIMRNSWGHNEIVALQTFLAQCSELAQKSEKQDAYCKQKSPFDLHCISLLSKRNKRETKKYLICDFCFSMGLNELEK